MPLSAQFQHAVQFYRNDESLSRTVAEFVADGVVDGMPAVVIATPEHCKGIAQALAARGQDMAALERAGTILCLDAAATLALFMRDGRPDPGAFQASVGSVVADMCRKANGGHIRAYGEMVDVLWKQGNHDAAIRLEVLWNDLSTRHSFQLLCGYAIGSFYKETSAAGHGKGYLDVCHVHGHVLEHDGATVAIH